MTRALFMVLVLALLVPAAAFAADNGGVAAPAANGGAGAGSPSVVRAPATPKSPPNRRKKSRRPPPAAPATPAPATGSTHVFPVAGAFTWPGPAGEFGAGRAGHIHQGFDLLAAQGTPVVAPY